MKRNYLAWAVSAIFLALALFLLLALKGTLPSLIIAFFFAYLLHPLVLKLERLKIRRLVSVPCFFALLLVLLAGLSLLVLPSVIGDAQDLVRSIPGAVGKGLGQTERLLQRYGIDVHLDKQELPGLLNQLTAQIDPKALLKPLAKIFSSTWQGVTGLLLILLNLFVIPIFFFFLILDFEKIRDSFYKILPRSIEPKIRDNLKKLDRVLSGYIRGQIVVALILATLYSLGLSLAGVPFAIPIGVGAGLLNIIPYLGLWTGVCLSLLFSAVNYSGKGPFIGILLTFGLVQLLEGNFLTPRIVGNKLGLSSLASVLAVIIGANLGGVVGLLVAIPAAAFLKIIVIDLIDWYQTTHFYKNETIGNWLQ